MVETPEDVIYFLADRLIRTESMPQPIVLMACGIAGAGKTTLSKTILKHLPNFTRLSIDEIIFSKHGLYGIDYPAELYPQYQDEADTIFRSTLRELLENGEREIILDRSFYAKEDRDEFKKIIENAGARWVLVYLKVEKEVLWRRIRERREKGIDANCALEIGEELLKRYVEEFEEPKWEGEVLVEWKE